MARDQPIRVQWRLHSSMYDSSLPVHLDAIVAYALTHERIRDGATGAIERLADDLPLAKEQRGDQWVWKASALIDDAVAARSMRYWTRKFDGYDWAHMVTSNNTPKEVSQSKPLKPHALLIDVQRGPLKQYFEYVPVKLVPSVTAYCVGDIDRLAELLDPAAGWITSLGARRRMGFGMITDGGFEIDVDEAAHEKWQHRILPWPHEGAEPIQAAFQPPYHSPANRALSYMRPEVLG